MYKFFLGINLGILISSTTFGAGDYQSMKGKGCEVRYTREACVGKDKDGKTYQEKSYKKCSGNQSCFKKILAKTEADCIKKAKTKCPNSRIETRLKSIEPIWNGKLLNHSDLKSMTFRDKVKDFNGGESNVIAKQLCDENNKTFYKLCPEDN